MVLSTFDSIAALRVALHQRRVSAAELARDALESIAAHTHLNAFLHVDDALTLAQANAADARLAQHGAQAAPLTGIPIAHKDVFVTQGWRSTAASRMLEHYRSPFDATVVANLQEAGAVSLGKLNCDEFAMGSGNEHSAFGCVRNPWDADRVPGGSAAASAAHRR